jgi:hypothetical protein
LIHSSQRRDIGRADNTTRAARSLLVDAECFRVGLETVMVIKITPNDKGSPAGKLADAEMHFDQGELEGMKLVGFAVWERRAGPGRNVTFPSRAYSVNGERRSFALLRPMADAAGQDRIRDLILHAYAEFEARAAVAS